MAISKSSEAVLWLQSNPGKTQADAAAQFGVKPSTISRALAKRATETMCPHCGQTMNMAAKRGPKTQSE